MARQPIKQDVPFQQPEIEEHVGTNVNPFSSLQDLRNNLLTLDDLETIISKHVKGNDFTLHRHQLFSLSGKTEGFLGVHFILHVDYSDKKGQHTKKFFLKLLNGALNIIFEIVLSLNAYDKEHFYYEILVNEFEKFSIDASFAPNEYFCKPYVIVLEDVKQNGYRNAPKREFFDLQHCRVALKTLAKFHASTILYEHAKKEKDPNFNFFQTHQKMLNELIFTKNPNSMAKSWFNYSLQGLYLVAEHVPERGFKKDFVKKVPAFVKQWETYFDGLDKYKGTLLHGDLWSNNFMFKYEDTTPTDAILVDFQLIKYGPPALDVLHVIYCNTRKSLRDEFFTYLKQFYYNTLQNALGNINLETIMPKEEFNMLCKKLECVMKLQCICDRCVTFIPDEYLVQVTGSGKDEDMKKFLFEERPLAIVNCYKPKGFFRDLLTEDILELRDMLKDFAL